MWEPNLCRAYASELSINKMLPKNPFAVTDTYFDSVSPRLIAFIFYFSLRSVVVLPKILLVANTTEGIR